MAKNRTWQQWGARLKIEMQAKGVTTQQIAARTGKAYSTVRGWINGSRQVNLSDFFLICNASGIDPAIVLFTKEEDAHFQTIVRAWARSDQRGKELMLVAAEAAERISGEKERDIRIVPPRPQRG